MNLKEVIVNLKEIKLTEKEIAIAKLQLAIKQMGFQYTEHQFNDGFDEVYIEISKSKEPSIFDRHLEDAGWGRMGRLTAWTNAYEYAKKLSYEKTYLKAMKNHDPDREH
jgi:hypothetical protein